MATNSDIDYVEITRTTVRVAEFLEYQRSETLALSPSFQRRSVWRPSEKSFFLDTIVRGLPVPIVFVRDKLNLARQRSLREVVDGQQRLRTLFAYIDPSSLGDYDVDRDYFQIAKRHSPELADKDFRHLPAEMQTRILSYQFSVHILPADMDDTRVLDIFIRINSTGRSLNNQELRHAQYYDSVMAQTAKELALEQLGRWRTWKVFTEQNIARMEEVELTSEFILLMYEGVGGRAKRPLDQLYARNQDTMTARGEVQRRFGKVMDVIDDVLGAAMSSLPFRRAALFYPLFACMYDVLYALGSDLKRRRAKALPRATRSNLMTAAVEMGEGDIPEDVGASMERRTTHLSSRTQLLKFLRGKVDGR